jgi:hypothetical protein
MMVAVDRDVDTRGGGVVERAMSTRPWTRMKKLGIKRPARASQLRHF